MNCLIDKKNARPLDADLHVDPNALYLSLDTIHKLPRPHNGQVAIDKDTNITYVYNNGWQPLGDVKVAGEGLKMSLYDLNQNIMEQLPDITEFDDKITLINEFKELTNNKYYMLYSKDISYFTMFVIEKYGEMASLGDAVIECLKNLGKVKSIDFTENRDAIEVWVEYDGKIICAYFFPYDNGILTVEAI